MPKLLDDLELPNLDGAKCRGSDPELWFEGSDGAPSPAKLAVLYGYCRPCPVRQACLEFALRRDMYGVWGGLTQAERRLLMPKRAVCGECGAGFERRGRAKFCSRECQLAAAAAARRTPEGRQERARQYQRRKAVA